MVPAAPALIEGEWIPLSQRQAEAKAKIEEEERAKKIAAIVAPCVLDSETGLLVIPDKCLPIKHWTRWHETSRARSETVERRRTNARQLANRVMRCLAAKSLPLVYNNFLSELELATKQPLDAPAAKSALPSEGEWIPFQRQAQAKEKLEESAPTITSVHPFCKVELRLKKMETKVVAHTAAPAGAGPPPAPSCKKERIPVISAHADKDSELPTLNKEMSDRLDKKQKKIDELLARRDLSEQANEKLSQAPANKPPAIVANANLAQALCAVADVEAPATDFTTPLPMLKRVNSVELFSKLHVTTGDDESASDEEGASQYFSPVSDLVWTKPNGFAGLVNRAHSNSFTFGGNKRVLNLGARRPNKGKGSFTFGSKKERIALTVGVHSMSFPTFGLSGKLGTVNWVVDTGGERA
jgi:hypothetical protein